MLYNNYLETISDRFRRQFDEISTIHNFDQGDEFEIAICKILRIILPAKFGICRGHVIAADGRAAGDDIIIFNRERFSTLRLLDNESYDRKQHIPIEAVYAYIEAKHSLIFNGKDENISKAIEQVSKAKVLIKERKPVKIEDGFDPYIELKSVVGGSRKNWPAVMNLPYGVVFSRYVRKLKGGVQLTGQEIISELSQISGRDYADDNFPDLIIAGEDIILIPVITNEENKDEICYESPFFCAPERTEVVHIEMPGIAIATGICSLLYALDMIRLGKMPWPELIEDAIKHKKD